ncbi:MAG: hypothetical protein EOP48_33080, partial [Sphingobacteriales bacterium]
MPTEANMVLAKAGSEYHVDKNTKLLPAFSNTSTLAAISMRSYLLIIVYLASCVSCRHNEASKTSALEVCGYWVSQYLDQYEMDPSVGSGKTVYGGGRLLYLNLNGECKSLSGGYYWENDSLYKGGEPGTTIRAGTWEKRDRTVFLNQRLVFKTFMLTGTKVGDIGLDTIHYKQPNSLIYLADTLVRVKNISQDLINGSNLPV